jgi:hypothetical protein
VSDHPRFGEGFLVDGFQLFEMFGNYGFLVFDILARLTLDSGLEWGMISTTTKFGINAVFGSVVGQRGWAVAC